VRVKRIKKNGFTLIELMIAMMLGLIVVGGALSIYISTIKSSSDVGKSARLNYDLDSVMQLMVNDIRRAGFTGIPVGGLDTLNNAFMATTTTLNIRTLAAPTVDPTPNSGDCILYSYDVDDGNNRTPEAPDGIINSNEYFGFKLDRGAIWIRYSGTHTSSCADGNWERITNEKKILINYLQFNFLPIVAQVNLAFPALTATSRCLNYTTETITNALTCEPTPATNAYVAQKRIININLRAYVKGDDSVLKSLSATVQVRNSRLYKTI
jgi:type IV pilus assembly protein PilW